MKGVLFVFLAMFSFWSVDLDTVRKQFEEAETSKEATESLYKLLKDYQKDDPVLLAYKGAALTLRARYLDERSEKKAMVSQGIALLERAVKSAPQQVEVRLVRLAVQEHSPKILKYKMNMSADKQMILSNIAEQPAAIKLLVRRYVKHSHFFTAEEQRKLSQ